MGSKRKFNKTRKSVKSSTRNMRASERNTKKPKPQFLAMARNGLKWNKRTRN